MVTREKRRMSVSYRNPSNIPCNMKVRQESNAVAQSCVTSFLDKYIQLLSPELLSDVSEVSCIALKTPNNSKNHFSYALTLFSTIGLHLFCWRGDSFLFCQEADIILNRECLSLISLHKYSPSSWWQLW